MMNSGDCMVNWDSSRLMEQEAFWMRGEEKSCTIISQQSRERSGDQSVKNLGEVG